MNLLLEGIEEDDDEVKSAGAAPRNVQKRGPMHSLLGEGNDLATANEYNSPDKTKTLSDL